ncbi:MAG: type II toxin-antitoxin system RelE/ParE family toxin [Thermodesulfobacteriota bacterium]|nr:type II toxin-antitoxin system RelE/ParE family toxin [Thermodesulfobacteriota bacterium]
MYLQSAFKKYNRIKKKLPLPLRNRINLIEDEIALNPYSGERKKGDLKEVFVKKFPLLGEEYLLAYEVNEKEREVIFLTIGGHENFYLDLKRYLKS